MPDATFLHQSGKDLAKGVFNEHLGGVWPMADHTPMQLEKYYTCCIERRWQIPYNPPSARLVTDLLVSNA